MSILFSEEYWYLNNFGLATLTFDECSCRLLYLKLESRQITFRASLLIPFRSGIARTLDELIVLILLFIFYVTLISTEKKNQHRIVEFAQKTE